MPPAPNWRAVIYFTETEREKICALALQDGLRTPHQWVASSIRKQLLVAS